MSALDECARCEDDTRIAGRPTSLAEAAGRLLGGRRCAVCGAPASVFDPRTGKWYCRRHAPRLVAAAGL
ncbi:MAG: hypothetical protein DRJ96_07145 [Thermoprotei archaeon]|nr:MAG: hypothetical protein DRJ67_07795 [Thermoprotei archaeon]RLE96246.1 MAG: hypothetical protein DRJ96_07145 [Thermoprotei archaeon]